MNWDVVRGNWKQLQGKFTVKCGKLTDDDIKVFQGKRNQLAGKLQAYYGKSRDVTKKALDDLGRAI